MDANVLFLPVRNGFPLETEVERCRPGALLGVPRSVLAELDRLVVRGTPGAVAARAYAARFPRVPTRGRGDDAVLGAALRTHAIVATADRELRTRLLAQGIEVLAPRDRHRLNLHAPRVPARGVARRSANS